MWLLLEARTRHLSLHGTVGHLARVAYFACVALMEDSQSTGQCPQALCRGFHRFKDTRHFHLWGQNRQKDAATKISLAVCREMLSLGCDHYCSLFDLGGWVK